MEALWNKPRLNSSALAPRKMSSLEKVASRNIVRIIINFTVWSSLSGHHHHLKAKIKGKHEKKNKQHINRNQHKDCGVTNIQYQHNQHRTASYQTERNWENCWSWALRYENTDNVAWLKADWDVRTTMLWRRTPWCAKSWCNVKQYNLRARLWDGSAEANQ